MAVSTGRGLRRLRRIGWCASCGESSCQHLATPSGCESLSLTFSGDVRESIKALAEVYASRPFSHIEVSARALERIWQQCCKDGRNFEQFYLDMWSEIDNGNYAHVQRCYGDPLWIDLKDESNLDAMHEMAKELNVEAISINRLGKWKLATPEEAAEYDLRFPPCQ
mmetsp:Transcript_37073/g.106086  ORF Transcript_37073/g.106086 Transcript_37073/m.106086 type:complete len:166 (-) Transcript_37073:1409-1906(-)